MQRACSNAGAFCGAAEGGRGQGVAIHRPGDRPQVEAFLVGEAVFLGLPAVIAEMKARILAARHETGASQ